MESRIEQMFHEEMRNDTSFQEPETLLRSLFGSTKYTKKEARDIWKSAIKLGIRIGINRSIPSGQIIDLNKNTSNQKHKEFLEKFYKLANDYNCSIQYHHRYGLIITSKD